jgi:hypothetical protein
MPAAKITMIIIRAINTPRISWFIRTKLFWFAWPRHGCVPAELTPRKPTTGIAGCCACTASDQLTVVMTRPAIKLRRLMGAALGPSNTLAHRQTAKLTGHVRFTPNSGHVRCTRPCPLWANSGLMHCSKNDRHSISRLLRDAQLPRRYCPKGHYHVNNRRETIRPSLRTH